MKIKTSEAAGRALDCLVARALGATFVKTPESQSWLIHWPSPLFGDQSRWSTGARPYSIDWAQGGPIIGQKGILFHGGPGYYHAWIPGSETGCGEGSTHLIAGMRCFVASELGDEVDVPEELLT
jgi:hypothetical protein